MAIGDDAAAAGMALVNGALVPARDIDDEINRTRDYIANERAARTAADAQKVTLPADGGLMARREPGSVHNIGFYTTLDAALFFRPDATTGEFDRRVLTDAGSGAGYVPISGGTMTGNLDVPNIGVAGSIFNGGMTPVVSGHVAVYRDGSGRLGVSPSTRRAKKNIAAWKPDLQALLALQVVTFHYRASLFDEGDPARTAPPLEVGLIAEDLAALGLHWLVYLDEDGLPAGVHYERLALALVPLVQDHEARLSALEARHASG